MQNGDLLTEPISKPDISDDTLENKGDLNFNKEEEDNYIEFISEMLDLQITDFKDEIKFVKSNFEKAEVALSIVRESLDFISDNDSFKDGSKFVFPGSDDYIKEIKKYNAQVTNIKNILEKIANENNNN
jgi:hypothetical protein